MSRRGVREAALAPGVVAVALDHGADLIGDDGDRAEVVGVEIAAVTVRRSVSASKL